MELLFERVDGEVFDNVDMDVGDKLEVEEGADACTKSFKLVDDVDAFTWVLLGVLLEVTLGVKVVLLVCEDDALEIGTCFTVMVVPEGMFLVKFLFVMAAAAINDGDLTLLAVVVAVDETETRLPAGFLVIVVWPWFSDVLLFGDPILFTPSLGDFGGEEDDLFMSTCCCCFFAAARLLTIDDNVFVPLTPFLITGFC